ncbi:MAG: hypothetical protein JXR53_13880 [Bacteroidales bacterium]|nr:hypothetical protein [Bacteroidales bacterium]
MTGQFSIQDNFIQAIKSLLKTDQSLVNELSDLLHISTDSAYRRIRGETEFSISEMAKLCIHFQMSFDSLCNTKGQSVHFRYDVPGHDNESYLEYLRNIYLGMKMIHEAEDRLIHYVADDIPLFHLFAYPQLAAFKSYYYLRSVMNVEAYAEGFFEDAKLPDEIMEMGSDILSMYRNIPSVEIWGEQSINSILKQIEFYRESGFFNDEKTADNLLNNVSSLMNDIKSMCARSNKSPESAGGNNYTFYVCDIEIGNNCILAQAGQMRKVFLRHSTFHTIDTADPSFCNATEDWISGLIAKSNQISGMAEKTRNMFFQVLQKTIRP